MLLASLTEHEAEKAFGGSRGSLLHPITHKYEGSHNKSTFRGNQFPLTPFVSFRGLFRTYVNVGSLLR